MRKAGWLWRQTKSPVRQAFALGGFREYASLESVSLAVSSEDAARAEGKRRCCAIGKCCRDVLSVRWDRSLSGPVVVSLGDQSSYSASAVGLLICPADM